MSGGVKAKQFICSDVYIGENTWIGANTLILKGTRIGANCVIAGGSVVLGNIPDDSIFVQKRCREVIGYDSD